MKSVKPYLSLLGIFFLMSLALVPDASALSCYHPATKDSLTSATAVINGKVLESLPITSPARKLPYTATKVQVQVDHVFKGNLKTGAVIPVSLMAIYDAPRLRTNANYIFFFEANDAHEYQLSECSEYYELTKSMRNYSELLDLTH